LWHWCAHIAADIIALNINIYISSTLACRQLGHDNALAQHIGALYLSCKQQINDMQNSV
jgi:hypothetical protein